MIIATTENSSDNSIVALANQLTIKVSRGSDINVIERYITNAALKYTKNKNLVIIRLTGDCPLMDANYMDVDD